MHNKNVLLIQATTITVVYRVSLFLYVRNAKTLWEAKKIYIYQLLVCFHLNIKNVNDEKHRNTNTHAIQITLNIDIIYEWV